MMANDNITSDIEDVVHKAKKSAAALLEEAASRGSAKAGQARKAISPAIDEVETGLERLSGCVRSSPLTSLALAFLTGAGLVLMSERRRH